jgi:hypothetical protein
MADEKVVIKIDVRSDDSAIDRTRRKLERLSRSESKRYKRNNALASRATRDAANYARKTSSILENSSRKWKRHFDYVDKAIKMTGQVLSKVLMLTLKGVILEMAAMGASMVIVHGIFATGRGIMKLYNGTMKLLAAAAAGFAIAVGTVAAAVREQQAAMYAFTQTNKKEFGNSLNQTRVALRMLTADADLATVGVENLVAVYGEVSKKGKFTAGTQNVLKGLMDFASAGQDMKTGTKAAAGFLAVLEDTKKSYAEAVQAGKELGPQFEKAIKEYEKTAGAKDKTKDALRAAITSGQLAKMGGVAGQFEAINSTLFGMAKGYFTRLRNEFADFGQQFLSPVKIELQESYRIVRDGLHRMMIGVADFGKQGFIDKLSVLVQKITDFTVRLVSDYLPASEGMFERLGRWWDRFVDGWNRILDYLRPLIDGARVIERFIKNVFAPVWDRVKEKFGEFNKEVQDNEAILLTFGTKIGNLIAAVMDYFSKARKLFFEALPFINKLVDGVTLMVEQFSKFFGMFSGFAKSAAGGGGFGAFAGLLGLMTVARGMKLTKGGFVSQVSMSGHREAANMNVSAGTVYVNGRPAAVYGDKRNPGYRVDRRTNNLQTPFYGPRPNYVPTRNQDGSNTPYYGPRYAPAPNQRGSGDVLAPSGGTPGVIGPLGGPHGGRMIPRGGLAGYELVRSTGPMGRTVKYLYKGRGEGAFDDARRDAAIRQGQTPDYFRSGVLVPASERVDSRRRVKTVTRYGRMINRRERFARFFGESQTHGADGFVRDSRIKNFYDRRILRTRLGRALNAPADRYRDRQILNSQYLMPRAEIPTDSQGRPYYLRTPPPTGPGSTRFSRSKWGQKYYGSSFYNNFMAPQTYDPNGPMTRRQMLGAKIRGQRYTRIGAAIMGNDRKKGFNQSAMGGMATMLAMGMLSSKMDESAQGAMALGSTVAMINPLAGLAVGLGGAALNARTAKGGMGLGAGAGAVIGTMIAPGIGTAVGAIIGGIAGAAIGTINRKKNIAKKARDAMNDFMEGMLETNLSFAANKMVASGGQGASAILEAMKKQGTGLEGLKKSAAGVIAATGDEKQKKLEDLIKEQRRLGFRVTTEQEKAALANPEAAAQEIMEKATDNQAALNKQSDVYSKRLKELTRLTGQSEQEVELLARTVGVDLTNVTEDFTVQLEQLGVAMIRTAAQMRQEQMDRAIGGLDIFDEMIKRIEAPNIVDEKARAFREMLDAGGMTDAQMIERMRDLIPSIIDTAGGGIQGLLATRDLFQRGEAFTQKGGYFEGQADSMTAVLPLINQYLSNQLMPGLEQTGKDLNSQLLNLEDGRFSVDVQRFASQLAGMDTSQAKDIIQAIEQGQLFSGTSFGTASDVQEYLSKLGFGQLDVKRMEDEKELTVALEDLPDDIGEALTGFQRQFELFFTANKDKQPDWMSEEFIRLVYSKLPPDTSSPRGKGVGDTSSAIQTRLGKTLARHSAIDGMVTGRRNITSAWRNTNLGSPSSDHVMGRAYDLTGQNLGQYAAVVRANGGFAEFHGRGASRHLHVVPRLGPIGDHNSVASMSPMRAASLASGGSVIQITQHIHPSEGMDEHRLANLAVVRMREILDNERQRA